jgi:hypothetical protein
VATTSKPTSETNISIIVMVVLSVILIGFIGYRILLSSNQSPSRLAQNTDRSNKDDAEYHLVSVRGTVTSINYDQLVDGAVAIVINEAGATGQPPSTYYVSSDESRCDAGSARLMKSRQVQVGDVVEIASTPSKKDGSMLVCAKYTYIKQLYK